MNKQLNDKIMYPAMAAINKLILGNVLALIFSFPPRFHSILPFLPFQSTAGSGRLLGRRRHDHEIQVRGNRNRDNTTKGLLERSSFSDKG